MSDAKKSVKQIEKTKQRKIMQTVAWRASYYRENPHRFVSEVLFPDGTFKLKLFQKILLWAMMHYNFIMYLAARGQGKTMITALFCVVRCILYPGTKIIVVSGTLKQANELLLKIQDEFMPKSPFLCNEIQSCKIGQNDASIYFRGNSWIKTRTSTQNSRSARANILIADEFRMIDQKILNTVLRKFLTSPREPGYLNNPEYTHLKERNKEIYMSSAWFKSSWAYEKAIGYTKNFFDDTKKYFICGLPYQLSIMEGLLMKEQVQDEMSQPDWNDLLQSMQMECTWIGDVGDNLFHFDDFNNRRVLKSSFLPLKYYNDNRKVPQPHSKGKRVLSLDVALMKSSKSKKNDASALFINDLTPSTNTSYHSNIVYADTFEGLTTDQLGLIVMRYFYKYKCTDLVIDTNGIGLGVYDFLCRDQYDPSTGETYQAMTCANDPDMAERCRVQGANKVIWSVKATASFNNDITILLRNAILNGRISFLISQDDADEPLKDKLKGYAKLTPTEQALLKKPYAQTTMTEYELIKLNHQVKNGNIKVYQSSGMRKDRYSSLSYNYWCATQLELKLRPKESHDKLISYFPIRKARVYKSF